MTAPQPQHRQRKLLLALLLFLLGQLTLTLHSHDLSLHPVDADKCVVCLVTTSDSPGPISEISAPQFLIDKSLLLPALGVRTSRSKQTSLLPRAPPFS